MEPKERLRISENALPVLLNHHTQNGDILSCLAMLKINSAALKPIVFFCLPKRKAKK